MRLFVGTLDGYKLDSKGRLSVPTKWRERLGKEFYMVAVTVRGCKCLTLYPVEHFESTYDAMQQGTENQKYDATTSFLDNAEEGVLDAEKLKNLSDDDLTKMAHDVEVAVNPNDD